MNNTTTVVVLAAIVFAFVGVTSLLSIQQQFTQASPIIEEGRTGGGGNESSESGKISSSIINIPHDTDIEITDDP